MTLAVDANVFVGLLLRPAGQSLVRHRALNLAIADVMWEETEHNLQRRIESMLRRGRLDDGTASVVLNEALRVGRTQVQLVGWASYVQDEAEARRRMPHDLTDWPTIAVALLLGADIWTEDRHFHGCGVACWTTETLQRQLTGDSSIRP